MAKIFITNSEEITNNILSLNKDVFTKYKVETVDNCIITSFAKINNNSSVYNPKSSIWAAGTFIYKEHIGEEALELIYNDFERLGVAGLKKQIIGYYNIVIKNNFEIIAFNDYYGVYDLCYYKDSNYYAIGSHLKDVAQSVGCLELDEYSFIQEVCQTGAFPGKTIFKNIKKIKGDEYIRISNDNANIEILSAGDYGINYYYRGENEALKDISKMILKYTSIVSNAYGKVDVFMTGGLDSRLNFAAYSRNPAHLRTRYWRSFGVDKEDEIIAKKISSFYGIKFMSSDCFDPEDNNGIDWNYQKKLFNTVGFYNFVCNGNKKILDEIAQYGNEREFLAFGYFCEAIRLREWAAALGTKVFSIDDFVDKYYINKTLNESNYPRIENYRNYLRLNFIQQLNSIGITSDYDKIPLSYFEKFRWIMSRHCDSRMECLCNVYTFSFAIMSVPYIHQAVLSLPDDVIRDGVFQVKLINEIDKNLICNFDVFSHKRAYRLNGNYKKIRKFTAKNIADFTFMLLPVLKPILIALFRKHRNKSINIDTVYEQTEKIFKESKIEIDFNIENFKHNINDSRIKRFRQYLIANSYLIKGIK